MKHYKVVGKRVPPIDAFHKVTGQADYSADRILPNMLYAKVLGSAHPHAIVKSIDVSKAAALPGVISIITCKDAPKETYQPVEVRELTALSEYVRFVGDEIAAVAAETPEIAEEAIKLIDVQYEIIPAVFDASEALKADAPKLFPEGNLVVGEEPIREEWGDVDKAFKEACAVAEGSFNTAMQLPTPIEPRACVASWNNDELIVWTSTQFPHRVRSHIASVLSMPLNKISVRNTYVGGAFGGKKEERFSIIASLLSRKARRPVKYEYTREEEHTIARRRFSSKMDIRMCCDKEGRLTGLEYSGVYNVGAYGTPMGGSGIFILGTFFAYRFASARFTGWDVNTNIMTAQPFRGVQFPGFLFGIEQTVNELARKMNMDPVEFRRINTYRPNSVTEPYGEVLSSYTIEECLNKGKEVFGWDKKWKGWQPIEVSDKKVRGIGMGTSIGWCNVEREDTGVIVEVQRDGSAILYTGTTDLGTDSKTTLCQILAEELDMPLDKISIVTGDTKTTPFDHGCCASRTLYQAGKCINVAVEEVKKELFKRAGSLPNVKADIADMHLENGQICVKSNPSIKIPISDVLKHSVYGRGTLDAEEIVAPPTKYFTPLRSKIYVGGAGAHFVEVEVDKETGQVKILKLVAVHDAGYAINPSVVENQIHGATFQGIGYAMSEELRYDPKSNRMLEDSYTDYKIMTIADIPELQEVILESNEPLGPYGAMGIGEHALSCTAGAIANAIGHALGMKMPENPMIPERILQMLGKI